MTENQLRNAMTTYGNTVYRLALCRMQHIADAEDVYQDVFLRLLSQPADHWEGERLKASVKEDGSEGLVPVLEGDFYFIY